MKLWLALATALVFAAGAAVGYVGARGDGASGKTYLGMLADEYDLRPDQVDRIRALLEREEESIDRILDGVEAAVKEEIRQARARTEEDLREVLDDAQREKFDAARGR